MAQFATRPSFVEGQLLAASDLTMLADNPRAAAQRHNRFVHRWGIVSGLTLSTEDAQDSAGNAFKKVTLEPGMAIDGEGRELLVTQKMLLDPGQLRQAIGSSIAEGQLYPVFIAARIQEAIGSGAASVGLCAGAAASPKMEEAVQILFQQAGDELSEITPSPLSADPAPDGGVAPWPVFVGHVKWSASAEAFADTDASAARRFRRAAGVNAAVVAGGSHRMLLHPAPTAEAGSAALEISDTEDGPALVFGRYQSALAALEPLFAINANGDLKVKGSITGATQSKVVLVQSGVAGDGMTLALPDGVTAQQVADGDARIHVTVNPHIDPAASPDPGKDFAALVQECRVDERLQVHCRICWVSLPTDPSSPAVGSTAVSQPGQVNYLVCAIVSGE